MRETSVGKVLCDWRNDSGVCKLSLCHTFSSGMEHDVQERWQLRPTMRSVELASPIMPRLEVWSKKWDGQEFLCCWINCHPKCFILQCQWSGNQLIGGGSWTCQICAQIWQTERHENKSHSQFWMVLDIFKCDDVRHELLMVSAPQDVERICYGLLWCRPLAFLKSLIT